MKSTVINFTIRIPSLNACLFNLKCARKMLNQLVYSDATMAYL